MLIPGISGLLGLNLAFSDLAQWEVVGTTHSHPLAGSEFTTTNWQYDKAGDAKQLVEQVKPALVINCAAVASLDAAEQAPEFARRLHTDFPGELALACHNLGIHFVQLSTDAVFDGQKGDYTEEDRPNPINTYARTKLAGDEAVLTCNPDGLIARVNLYGWSLSGQRSLCEFFYNNLRYGNHIRGTVDLFYNPMMASDLADTLLEMVSQKLSGIYHVSTAEQISKYEFGCRLADQFGFDSSVIEKASWKDLALDAKRAPNLTLNVSRLIKALGHNLPTVDDGLTRLHKQLRNGYRDTIRKLAFVVK